jgi:nucleolin
VEKKVTKKSESSDSNSDSDSSDEEKEKPVSKKKVPKKVVKVVAKDESSDSGSSSDSDSSDEEEEKPAKKDAVEKKAEKKESSDSDTSSDGDSSDEEDEEPTKKVVVKEDTPKKTKPAKGVSSSSSDADSSSDSDSDDDQKAPEPEKAKKQDSSPDSSSDDSTQSSAPPADAMDETKDESTNKRKADDDVHVPSAKRAAGEGEGTKIYVRGLPWRASEEEVREFFVACGKGPVSIELPLMDDGRSSGSAIIDFSSTDDAAAAIELNGNDFQGRWLSIKYSTPKAITGPREPSKKEAGCMTVFIGNLPWDVDEDTIREVFGECGEIASVRFSTDRETGDFKGYGHVEFTQTEATDKAVALAGTEIMGRAVRVDFANEKKNNGFGGGGGRGRGDGRGRGGRFGRGGGRDYGGRGGSSGRGGGRAGGRGRGVFDTGFAKRTGAIAAFSGNKITFD